MFPSTIKIVQNLLAFVYIEAGIMHNYGIKTHDSESRGQEEAATTE